MIRGNGGRLTRWIAPVTQVPGAAALALPTPRAAKRSVAIVVALTALLATLALTAPSAQATAGSCWTSGTVNTPDFGVKPKRWCNNTPGAPVYSVVDLRYPHYTGHMYSNPSYFVCQVPGAANPHTTNSDGSVNSNHFWLYTQADTAVEGSSHWGFMPATYVWQGANEQAVPGVPWCGG